MNQVPASSANTVFGVDISNFMDRLWRLRRRISRRFLLLEFGSTSLTMVEAKYSENDVQFHNFHRVDLPPEAIERGVPADPVLMGSLIRDLCNEHQIPAHRVAVVLPPDAAFTKVIYLPADLPIDQAATYASDPASGLQIPIPLQQTDFDLTPLDPASAPKAPTPGLRPYFLASVPQKLVEQILITLSAARMELHGLEFGFISQMRLSESDLLSLTAGHYYLQLELLPNCSHATVISLAGPLRCDRLAAVREFPEPRLSDENAEAAALEGITAEAITLKGEGYLPISELDLRVLCREIKQLMQLAEDSLGDLPCHWSGVKLCGINSAHPNIAELLSTELQLPVQLVRPLSDQRVGMVVLNPLLVQQSLGRLIGLGLGLVPNQKPSLSQTNLQPNELLAEPPPTVRIAKTEESVGGEGVDGLGELRLSADEEEWPSIQGMSASDEEKDVEEPRALTAEESVGGEGVDGLGELRLSADEKEWPSIK